MVTSTYDVHQGAKARRVPPCQELKSGAGGVSCVALESLQRSLSTLPDPRGLSPRPTVRFLGPPQ